MARLLLTRRAQTLLESLPERLRSSVVETLVAIEADPEGAGKRLVGRMAGLWSARVGSYRVLYSIEKKQIVVRSIRHRGSAYRRRR